MHFPDDPLEKSSYSSDEHSHPRKNLQPNQTDFWNFLNLFKRKRKTSVFFMGPLIPLFWTSGGVYLGFQSQGGSLACVTGPICLPLFQSLDLFCETLPCITLTVCLSGHRPILSSGTRCPCRVLVHKSGWNRGTDYIAILFLWFLVSCGKIWKNQLGETLIWHYSLIFQQILSKTFEIKSKKQIALWEVLSMSFFTKFKFLHYASNIWIFTEV